MTIEDIALQMTPGIGVKGAVHLLGVFGSARDIFAAAPDELAGEAGLREEIARGKGAGALPPQRNRGHRLDRSGIPAAPAGNPRLSPCPIHKR